MEWIIGGLVVVVGLVVLATWRVLRNSPTCVCGQHDCGAECIDWRAKP